MLLDAVTHADRVSWASLLYNITPFQSLDFDTDAMDLLSPRCCPLSVLLLLGLLSTGGLVSSPLLVACESAGGERLAGAFAHPGSNRVVHALKCSRKVDTRPLNPHCQLRNDCCLLLRLSGWKGETHHVNEEAAAKEAGERLARPVEVRAGPTAPSWLTSGSHSSLFRVFLWL